MQYERINSFCNIVNKEALCLHLVAEKRRKLTRECKKMANCLHVIRRGAVISTSAFKGIPTTFSLRRGIAAHASFINKPIYRGRRWMQIKTNMNKTAKFLVSAMVLFLFIVIFGAIVGANSAAGRTPGILGLIVFAGLIGALRAIWKSNPNNKENNSDSSALQK